MEMNEMYWACGTNRGEERYILGFGEET